MIDLQKEILTFTEFINYCGISKSRGYKATHYKELPFYKPRGKTLYFKIEDVKKWLLQNRIESKEEIEATSKIPV